MDNHDIENKKISANTFIFPTFLLLIITIVKTVEVKTGSNWSNFGVHPQKIERLKGIFLSPFIHGSTTHLFNNLIPLFFLLSAMIHFYDKLGYLIYFLIHIGSGLILWIIGRDLYLGRDLYHIGASGVIYGLASFMFFSGIFRRNNQLLAFSLLITFLYGSMVWGIFPDTAGPKVSWDGHLSGAIIGYILSILLIRKGPQRKKYEWEDEDMEDNENLEGNEKSEETYIYDIVDN